MFKIGDNQGSTLGAQTVQGLTEYSSAALLKSHYLYRYAGQIGNSSVNLQNTSALVPALLFTLRGTDGGTAVQVGSFFDTRQLIVFGGGQYKNNTGANKTLRIQITFGGATAFDDTSGNISASATARTWSAWLVMTRTSSNSIDMFGHVQLSGLSTASTGVGTLQNAVVFNTSIQGTATLGSGTFDTDQDFNFNIQHSAASASLSLTADGVVVIG